MDRGVEMHFTRRAEQVTTKAGLMGKTSALASPVHDQSSRGFAVVVLAAGSSQGPGRPTALCPYLGRTLVDHVTRIALASGAIEVVVVAGEFADQIRHNLRRLPVRVVRNREWQEGIASSIRVGISGLASDPAAAIVYLCDQPKVTAEHLRSLGERALADGGTQIVASSYDGVTGAPAAFARSVFPSLLALRGDAGARHLIRNAGAVVETIYFADANEEPELPKCGEPPSRSERRHFPTERCERSREPRAPPRTRQQPAAV